jgi:hypothetical protein
LIDKLILFIRTRFGGIKYTKKAILCQGILAQDLGFILGAFSEGIRGILEIEVERGRLQRSGEALQGVLRLIRAQRFLPPSIPDLYD